MPRVTLRRRGIPEVSELRDIVWICTTTERPDDDVSTIKERPGVFEAHARIRNLRPDQILDYMAVFGTQDKPPSVEIAIRYPPDVKIDLHHWVYRETGDTPAWYRVRSVEDISNAQRWLFLNCSLDTIKDVRTDPVTQQPPPVWETP